MSSDCSYLELKWTDKQPVPTNCVHELTIHKECPHHQHLATMCPAHISSQWRITNLVGHHSASQILLYPQTWPDPARFLFFPTEAPQTHTTQTYQPSKHGATHILKTHIAIESSWQRNRNQANNSNKNTTFPTQTPH